MNRTRIVKAIVIIGLLIWLTASGCYRHVISEKGIGARESEIHEPNATGGGAIDEFLFGEEPKQDR